MARGRVMGLSTCTRGRVVGCEEGVVGDVAE